MKKLLTNVALLIAITGTAQNVGIGTAIPASRLHVADPSNDVQVRVESSAVGSESSVRILAGTNPFSFLQVSKWDAGSLGTLAGISKDNLSAIFTGGNAGPLLLNTGDGVSPLIFAPGNGEGMRITAAGNAGINNTNPQTVLHVNARPFPATNYNEAIRIGGTTPFISFYDDAVLKGYVQASLGGFEIGTKSLQTMNFFTNDVQRMTILANGRIGIGTIAPSNNLHVHDEFANQDASIILTNNLTGTNTLRGGRFRFLNSDLILSNYEGTGKIHFSTAFNTRMTIGADGNVGIGTTSPNHKLEIAANGTNTNGMKITHTGNQSTGVNVMMGNNADNRGLFVVAPFNFAAPTSSSVGVHSITGTGAPVFITPNGNYGIIGENQNPNLGIGVLGVSSSPSPSVLQAGVVGQNFSNDASAYGIIGSSSGSTGAGTVGLTNNATAGLLGYAHSTSTGPAIKSTSLVGSSQIGLELENGAIKVSGTNRTVFQHVTTAGNIISNETVIPNTTLANSATDMLIITPVWEGVYINAPIGVYFSAGSWRIFRQDLAAMPVGVKFNVLVVKQ